MAIFNGITLCFVVLANSIDLSKELAVSATRNGLEHIMAGPVSPGYDDGVSEVFCPNGTVVTGCYCSVPDKCDGARAEGHQQCVAQNRYGNSYGIQAVAVCLADNEYKYHYVKSGSFERRPVASCPSGYEVLSCTVQNYWIQNYPDGFSPAPYIRTDGTSCSTNRSCPEGRGCIVFAICRIA